MTAAARRAGYQFDGIGRPSFGMQASARVGAFAVVCIRIFFTRRA